jgi:hypothetical protein
MIHKVNEVTSIASAGLHHRRRLGQFHIASCLGTRSLAATSVGSHMDARIRSLGLTLTRAIVEWRGWAHAISAFLGIGFPDYPRPYEIRVQAFDRQSGSANAEVAGTPTPCDCLRRSRFQWQICACDQDYAKA